MNDLLACPVEGCPNTRSVSQAFCYSHWRALPRFMQTAITRTWRARLAARGGGGKIDARNARSEHLEALERAEARLEGREPNPRIWGGE